MLARVEAFLKKMRRLVSRSEWAINLMRLSKVKGMSAEPGLVLVQIDGLAYKHFYNAMERGCLPFLRSLIEREAYIVHRHYSGVPSNTPAVQGEILYGKKACTPAFRYRDKKSNEVFTMYSADSASRVEESMAQNRNALLEGGKRISATARASPHRGNVKRMAK